MVAAMHTRTVNDKTAFGLRTTDLRNIAIGFAAAILLVMVAGQMSDSGSASVLDETAEKRFAAPTFYSTDVTTVDEDVAYSYTVLALDTDGDDITLTVPTIPSFLSFTQTDTDSNAAGSLTGTPDDDDVGAHTVTLQAEDANGDTAQHTFTVTVAQINDEPTLSASAASSPTFTEGDSNGPSLFTGAAVADSDSQVVQTFQEIVITVTNVADSSEFLTIDGSDCDIDTTSASSVANTATNAGLCAVSVTGTTSTVTWTADVGNELSNAEMIILVNALSYTNTDDDPTASNHRVITITTMEDSGATGGSNDNSVTVSISNTVDLVAVNDAPSVTGGNAGAVTEDAGTTTASSTVTSSDAEGDTITWSCSGCADAGATQTKTGTYGSFVLTEATGAWVYTLDNTDDQTNELDEDDSVSDTLTVAASDGALSGSGTVTVTITGNNDATSAGADQTGAITEDAGTTTSTGTVAGTDVDDEAAITYACSGCADVGATQTKTGTYGAWVLTEASGAWVYTIDNTDSDTNALDESETVDEGALTVTATDSDQGSSNTDTMTITITITGNNDVYTAGSDQTGAVTEDSGADVTGTVADTDPDGDASITFACSGCSDAGATQTTTGTYGGWTLTEATGAWV